MALVHGFLVVPVSLGQTQPLEAIEKFAQEAFAHIDKSIEDRQHGWRTVVLPFTGFETEDSAEPVRNYAHGSNSDERYFEVALFENLVASKKFKVFTRNKLDKALGELKLQMKDLFDPQTAKRVGKFVGADLLFLMEGYIGCSQDNYCRDNPFVPGGSFRVRIMVIDVETAEVKSVWKKFVRGWRP